MEVHFDALIGLATAAIGALFGSFITILGQFWNHRQAKQFIAAEKRLEAHQKLFALWWRVALTYHDDDKRGKLMMECREFWNANCLYLGQRSREKFSNAMNDLAIYGAYKGQWKSGLDKNGEKMKMMFQHVAEVFPAIYADAEIPGLHEGLVNLKTPLPDWSGVSSNPLF